MTTTLGGHSSLSTPREHSNNASSRPLSLFPVFLAESWWRMQIVDYSNISVKYSTLSSKIFRLKSCTRSLSSYPLKLFPQFPSIEFIWSTFTWMITSLEWAASTLFNGNFYKDYLGVLGQFSLIERPALIPLSWGIMTPNVGRFPPTTVGCGLRMLPHVSLLSTQSPPPINK